REDDADVTPVGPRTGRSLSSVWWPALALGGLLVGIMALMSEPSREGSGPAGRLLLDLPAAVWGVATVAGSLAIMLWFAFLLALARRHQKDPKAGRSLWSVLIFSLIVTAVALWHRDLPQGLLLRPPDPQAMLDEQKTTRPAMD